MNSKYVYVSLIKTTPEKLWNALTSPEFIRQYWGGVNCKTDWKVGSPWSLSFSDGTLADSGEILEIISLKKIVIKWRNEFMPELKIEGYSRCTIELAPKSNAVLLTITHEMDRPDSVFVEKVSGGWPIIISNLKSLLETGNVIFTEFGDE